MPEFAAILFDLDGTLADTAPDLAFALNTLLQESNKQVIDYTIIRPFASHGSPALLKLGFGIETDHPDFPELQQRFIQIYQDNIARETRLFAGMEQVLNQLDLAKIPWGIVTNKPAFLTEPLLKELNLDHRAACVVSSDTTAHSKPHPEPMFYACQQINLAPEQCLYIGDAARDIEAGKNANMQTVLAYYGYLSADDKPDTWQSDFSINQPSDILLWI